MSKKSRRRNKKILGVLGALGAAALLGRKGTAQGVSGSDKAKFTSDEAYTAPVTGTNYPGANKAVVAAPIKKPVINLGRMEGHGPESGVVGQNKRADYAQKMRSAVTGVDGPPSVLNPYRAPRQKLRTFKSGGSVKGGGKAKRGLGRAFTKAKK